MNTDDQELKRWREAKYCGNKCQQQSKHDQDGSEKEGGAMKMGGDMSELLCDEILSEAIIAAEGMGRTAEVYGLKELRRWRLALVWLSEQDQGAVFKNVHGVFCASVGECETYRVAIGKTPLEAIEALRKKVGP